MQKSSENRSQFSAVTAIPRHVAVRQYIAILVFIVGIAFMIIDLLFVPGLIPGSLPFYAGLLFSALAGFWLNRKQHYTLSSIIILVGINTATVVFASSSKGVILLFIPNAVGALLLINYKSPLLRWGFVALSYALFTLSYFVDFDILTAENMNKDFHSVVFFACATVAIFSILYIVHFFLQVNFKAGKSLQENAQQLTRLTTDLKKSKVRFEMVIQGSRAGIYEWNVKTNTIYVSPEWKNILGFSEDDMQDLKIEDLTELTHPDDREQLKKGLNQHFATHEPFQNESRRRHKNGSYRWIFDSGLSRTDEHGNIEVIVGSIIDITDRKHTELQVLDQNELLKKANQDLDRFVYSASHDLRSPLSSVLGLLSIAEHTSSVDEIRTYHAMMRDRIQKLDSFVTEVLDYSRNNRQEIVKTPVSLAALIGEIVESLRFSEESSVIAITHHVHKDLVIETDSARLKIILNNLIGNSIKYCDRSKENPFIKIHSTLDDNGYCHIGVEDNGVGIDHPHQEKVFNMFYRATQQSKGSGLGLYITKEMVEKLGGKISMTSSPGKGTHLSVFLPVR